MAVIGVEQRLHRRVECFLVQAEQEHLPVWVFKPDDALQAHAGLVLNVSDGGLQVLTGTDDSLTGATYDVQLLLGEDDSVPRFRGRATRVWTRPSSIAGHLSGLRFDEPDSSAEDFIRSYLGTAPGRAWVRCVLFPA